MIHLLVGDNSFAIEQERRRLEAGFDGVVEKRDGAALELRDLPELVMGATLFAPRRMVVVRGASENTAVWNGLADWLERASYDIHLIFIEAKLDKRTKTYKLLQKIATVIELKQWTERETRAAEDWVREQMQARGKRIDAKSASLVVQRSMVASDKPGGALIDQWRLNQAIEKLALLDEITPEMTDDIIEPSALENVFDVFDAALRGNTKKVAAMLQNLQLSEEPYRLFGLLGGQVFQLVALAISDQTTKEVAAAIGAHPYALGKLAPHAEHRGKKGARYIVSVFAEADKDMKSSGHDPWLLIERALLKVASAT